MRVRGNAPYPAILLPDKAIATDQGRNDSCGWLTRKSVWNYRKGFLGAHYRSVARWITQGLKSDEWVVIEGSATKSGPAGKVNPERISLAGFKAGLRR